MAAKATEAPPEKKQVTRREFLNIAWLASLGLLSINLGGVTFLFAMPRFKEGEFGGLYTVGTVSELPEAGSPPLNIPKVKLWVSNTPDGVMAIYKVCTHLGCLYNWNSQENKFICPCHGSEFQANGTWIHGPAPRSLDRFVVQAVNPETDEVLAEAVDGKPLPVPDDPNVLIRVDTGRKVNGETHA